VKTWKDKKHEIREKLGDKRSDRLEATARIVNRLYERRLELGWTQSQLAEKVGCRQEQIARLESGAIMPRIDTVATIAKALGLRIDLGVEEAATALSTANNRYVVY